MWISVKDVKDFNVPIGAVVNSVDGLGMLLTDDQGEVRLRLLRHKFPEDYDYRKCSSLICFHEQALFENFLSSLRVNPLFLDNTPQINASTIIGQVPSLVVLKTFIHQNVKLLDHAFYHNFVSRLCGYLDGNKTAALWPYSEIIYRCNFSAGHMITLPVPVLYRAYV